MSTSFFWKRCDIRAVVGEHFNQLHYYGVGQAFARYIQETLGTANHPHWVAVGHDARLHSPPLYQALIEGLTHAGIQVLSLGLATSPMVYFSEHLHTLNADVPELAGTLTVTASHNPAEYNGIKFSFQKHSLAEADFERLRQLFEQQMETPNSVSAFALPPGTVRDYSILPDYIAWFEAQFATFTSEIRQQNIRVVIDSGNATAGIVAPTVFRQLGCNVTELFSEPDGHFPNHHPDPCVPENLRFLQEKILETSADFGIAFDGDADRLGLVDDRGQIIPGDYTTLLLAEDVLVAQPGATIVFDIKGSQTLIESVQQRGGKPLFAPSGHVFMKRLMKEQSIPLGGELSGHLFFRDQHWGFDDALYAACRVLTALVHRRRQQADYRLSHFVQALPPTRISEEMRLPCRQETGQQLILDLQALLKKEPDYFGAPCLGLLTLDGLRVTLENGFFLLRVSNTEPCITVRFEAPTEAIYQRMAQRVQALCDARFQLPLLV